MEILLISLLAFGLMIKKVNRFRDLSTAIFRQSLIILIGIMASDITEKEYIYWFAQGVGLLTFVITIISTRLDKEKP